MSFDGTLLYGNRGYNEETSFFLCEKVGLGFLHTTKCGPLLCFVFGTVNYKTNREQRTISENGPMMSIEATRAIRDTTSHLVLYRNGTGRVAILQSSDPSLSYSNIEYVTTYSDIDYATTYSKIIMEQSTNSANSSYDPTKYISSEQRLFYQLFEKHNLCSMTKSQGGIEWHYSR